MSKIMDAFEKMYFNALDNRPDLMGNAPDPRKKKSDDDKQAEAVPASAPVCGQSLPFQNAPQQPTCIIIQQPMAMPQNQAFVVPEGYRLVREDEFDDCRRRNKSNKSIQKQTQKERKHE